MKSLEYLRVGTLALGLLRKNSALLLSAGMISLTILATPLALASNASKGASVVCDAVAEGLLEDTGSQLSAYRDSLRTFRENMFSIRLKGDVEARTTMELRQHEGKEAERIAALKAALNSGNCTEAYAYDLAVMIADYEGNVFRLKEEYARESLGVRQLAAQWQAYEDGEADASRRRAEDREWLRGIGRAMDGGPSYRPWLD